MRITKASLDRKANSLAKRIGLNPGVLFVRRCDTQRPLYQLARQYKGCAYDDESDVMTAQELDAYLMGALKWTGYRAEGE
jgi:hypothetical protein